MVFSKHQFFKLSLQILFVFAFSVSIFGCSSGGSDATPESTNEVIKTGTIIDSPVENISFNTPTQAGTTNINGEFTYKQGEMITFSIGAMVFPPVVATEVITPLTLAGASSILDQQATNIARLMQSLDKDGNPLNGIAIPSSAALIAAEVDFNVDTTTFENNPAVINLVANSGSVNVTLVTVEEAQAHVTDTLFNMTSNTGGDEGTLVPFEPVLISSDIPYLGTISAFRKTPVAGQSFYSFTATSDSIYTISVTNVSPDGPNLGWVLYHIGTEGSIARCDNDVPNFNEICETPLLVKDEIYLIQVGNASSIGASYKLLASPGGIQPPTIENEGSTGFPVSLTIQLKHEGTISAEGISVYSFDTVASIPYTISLLNVNPLGINLNWALYDSNDNLIHECKDNVNNGEELCTTDEFLMDNSTYKVFVYNRSTEAATFDLTVY